MCNFSTGTNGASSPQPSTRCIVVAALPGQNLLFNIPTINVEFEACARTVYKRGGGRDCLRELNNQWSSTSSLSTQGHHPFSHINNTVSSNTAVEMIIASTDKLE
jgi:hypothetical protein